MKWEVLFFDDENPVLEHDECVVTRGEGSFFDLGVQLQFARSKSGVEGCVNTKSTNVINT